LGRASTAAYDDTDLLARNQMLKAEEGSNPSFLRFSFRRRAATRTLGLFEGCPSPFKNYCHLTGVSFQAALISSF